MEAKAILEIRVHECACVSAMNSARSIERSRFLFVKERCEPTGTQIAHLRPGFNCDVASIGVICDDAVRSVAECLAGQEVLESKSDVVKKSGLSAPTNEIVFVTG